MSFFAIAKTLIKSFFRKPSTVAYPFGPREYYKGTRGAVAIVVDQCIFCGICQKKCPTGAITINRNDKTWTITRARCISCAACVEVCPKKCLSLNNKYNESVTQKKDEVFKHA